MKKVILFLIVFIALLLLLSCNERNDPEKINSLLDKYIEAWNTGNISLFDGIVDSTFELRKTPDFQPLKGIKFLENYLINTRKAVPDFTLKEAEKLFISDTAVVLTWNFTGTYKGDGDLIPAGGRLNIPGFSVIYFNKDKITGEWIAFSDLTWVRQIGYKLLPPASEM